MTTVPATGSLNTLSTSAEVASLVKRLADELERVVAPKALASGQRQEMSRILAIADGIRRAVELAEERAVAAASRPAVLVAAPPRASVPVSVAHVSGQLDEERDSDMEYRRSESGDVLIRRGQIGTSKEYQQRVPRAAVEAITAWIDDAARSHLGGFGFQAIAEALGDRIKGYQIRIVSSWLRDHGLLQEPTRGHYHVNEGAFAERAKLAFEALPVGMRRRRSKRRQLGRRSPGRRSVETAKGSR